MENIAVPLVAATVFTAGGYAITRAQQHAEAVGDWLFTLFVMTLLVGATVFAHQALERRRPTPRADQWSTIRSQTAIPPVRAWAQIED